MLEGDFDEDFNDFILEQLRVDFVRNKEYTVVPFARKYLNEFNRQNWILKTSPVVKYRTF